MSSTKKRCACQKEYTGILKEPHVIKDFATMSEEERAHGLMGWINKLVALCDHFNIKDKDPDTKWFLLALALAQKHVPGFAIVTAVAKGRPHDFTDDVHIYVAIEKQLKIAGTGNVRGAVKTIAGSNPEFKDFKTKPDSLRTRYLRIKKSIDELTHDAANNVPIDGKNYSQVALFAYLAKKMISESGVSEDQLILGLADSISVLPPRIPKRKKIF